jgi:hypothetical protein
MDDDAVFMVNNYRTTKSYEMPNVDEKLLECAVSGKA